MTRWTTPDNSDEWNRVYRGDWPPEHTEGSQWRPACAGYAEIDYWVYHRADWYEVDQ